MKPLMTALCKCFRFAIYRFLSPTRQYELIMPTFILDLLFRTVLL